MHREAQRFTENYVNFAYAISNQTMATFLFDEIIFGPVKSRRLGVSLGINLLPAEKKICNFNCIYCECGWNADDKIKAALPKAEEVKQMLEARLQEMKEKNGGRPPGSLKASSPR